MRNSGDEMQRNKLKRRSRVDSIEGEKNIFDFSFVGNALMTSHMARLTASEFGRQMTSQLDFGRQRSKTVGSEPEVR